MMPGKIRHHNVSATISDERHCVFRPAGRCPSVNSGVLSASYFFKSPLLTDGQRTNGRPDDRKTMPLDRRLFVVGGGIDSIRKTTGIHVHVKCMSGE